MTLDMVNNAIHIKPAYNSWGYTILPGAPPDEHNETKRGGKPPRPPNAFILYRQHHHFSVKTAYPDFHNNQICMLGASERFLMLIIA